MANFRHTKAFIFFNAPHAAYFSVKSTTVGDASQILFHALRRAVDKSILPLEIAQSSLSSFDSMVDNASEMELWEMPRYHTWWRTYDVLDNFRIESIGDNEVIWNPYPDETMLKVHGERSLPDGFYREHSGEFVDGELVISKEHGNIWFFKRMGSKFGYHRTEGPAIMLTTNVEYFYVDDKFKDSHRPVESI